MKPDPNSKVIVLYKPLFLTPLQTLNLLRESNSEYQKTSLTYAGRLDPMAEGVMLVLRGDMVKEKERFLSLEKEYEMEILLGVGTDTGDILGLVDKEGRREAEGVGGIEIEKCANKFVSELIGIRRQIYPKYSSPRLAGKESFEKDVEIFKAEVLSQREARKEEISQIILKKIEDFSAIQSKDFRQKDILESWLEYFAISQSEKHLVLKIRITCSSGTYMRVIAQDLGDVCGVGALALSIKRTKVGEYGLSDCLQLR